MNADRERFCRLRLTGWEHLPTELQHVVLELVTDERTVGALRLVDKTMLRAVGIKFDDIFRQEIARVQQMQLARFKNCTKVSA